MSNKQFYPGTKVSGDFESATISSKSKYDVSVDVVLGPPQAAVEVPRVKSVGGGKNQFEIISPDGSRTFQSYETRIAYQDPKGKTYLDKMYWDFSHTSNKFRMIFLNEGTEISRKKIESGEYSLVNLNAGRKGPDRRIWSTYKTPQDLKKTN